MKSFPDLVKIGETNQGLNFACPDFDFQQFTPTKRE